MTQKHTQQNVPCPKCNSTMAASQTERGAFFICGACGEEIPVTERGTVEE